MNLLAQSDSVEWIRVTSSHSWLAVITAIGTLLLSFWLLRHRFSRRGVPVIILRTMIFLTLALGCLGWIEQQRETEPPRIAIVLDLSASMASPARHQPSSPSHGQGSMKQTMDSQETSNSVWEETRLGQALRQIPNEPTWLAELEQGRQVDWFSIGDRLRAQPDGMTLLSEARSPRQSPSFLIGGIAELTQQLEGRNYAGVILLTDGVDTSAESWTRLEELLQRASVPWYPIRVGEAGTLDPVTIEIEPYASQALVGETLIIHSRLRSSNPGVSQVQVQLRDESSDQTLATRNWNRAEETAPRFSWEVPLRRPGLQRYSLHVVSESGVQLADPTIVSIEAIRYRSKILLVAAEPCYEFRYLKHALERARVDGEGAEAAFSVFSWLQNADLEYVATDPSAITRMPSDTRDLAEYDLVVLIDPATTQQDPTRGISTDDLESLRDYVEQEGGNLFLIAGPLAGNTPWSKTPIESLLPCEASQFFEQIGDAGLTTRMTLEPTEIGLELAPLRGLASGRSGTNAPRSIADESKPERLQVTRVLAPLSLHPTARPLLVTTPSDSSGSTEPLIAATWQPFGRGSVVYQGFDEAYWIRRRTSDEQAARYWVQWAHHLARLRHLENRPSVQVRIEPESPRAGQRMRFHVTSGNPSSLPSQLWLLSPSRDSRTIPLHERERDLGWSDGETLVQDAGTHLLQWTDRQTGEARELRFEVQPAQSESDSQPANHQLLEFLAESSGGKVQSPVWFGELPYELSRQAFVTNRIISTRPVWQLPVPLFAYGLILITLILSEWWLRKP